MITINPIRLRKTRQAVTSSLVWLGVAFSPAVTWAQDEEMANARLIGYPNNAGAGLEPGTAALVYLLLTVLGLIAIGVLFKNPKRTHLD